MKKMKITLLAAFLVLSLVVILYLLIANRLAEKNASLIETQYTERIETLYDTELQELRDRAQRYNGTLQTATGAAFSKEALTSASEIYDELLNVQGDGLMGYNMRLYTYKQRDLNCKSAYELSEFTLTDYGLPDEKFGVISIPKLDLEMPLFLGASEANMAAGAAVLSQTSIPIGGDSSNAVIAGHRGWNGYPYFLDIEKLEEGDEVTITNIWGTLRYQVTETQIIAPNDVNAILIRPGRDMITLLTCHPPNTGGRCFGGRKYISDSAYYKCFNRKGRGDFD